MPVLGADCVNLSSGGEVGFFFYGVLGYGRAGDGLEELGAGLGWLEEGLDGPGKGRFVLWAPGLGV
ncbi:hypothetical protein CFREI_04165 [Corynebacterium freiburgense]|nr:hypothetical protein CFREI_04165 [Corynebacterium freiburgense]